VQDEEHARLRAMASSQKSVSKTLDQAYSRYEDYLSKRKQVDVDSEQYVREQRYLSEQVELLPLPSPLPLTSNPAPRPEPEAEAEPEPEAEPEAEPKPEP
jgi:hypothetical protein